METLTLYRENGTQVRAHIHQERLNTSSFDGVGSIPGMQTIRLQDGTPLNYVDEKTFKNVVTGELLSRTPTKGR
jgi:hypothetical protein